MKSNSKNKISLACAYRVPCAVYPLPSTSFAFLFQFWSLLFLEKINASQWVINDKDSNKQKYTGNDFACV